MKIKKIIDGRGKILSTTKLLRELLSITYGIVNSQKNLAFQGK